jgi:3-hydroxybutyryl-CoA dehydrogenase
MEIKEAAVVGGGTMGSGIAHVFALSGLGVTLIESNQQLADKAVAGISKNMERQVAKGTINDAQKKAALGLLKTALKLEDASRAQLVVEAVPEIMALKREVFSKLDAACPPETILASNTSSLPITAIASSTKRAPKVIGMHFMNPVPVMKLVELIRGNATSDETYKTVHELTLKLGKTPAVSNDFPGFIANRILMPMINEAVYALMEGVATKEDIDTTMKLGMAHPMGPLTLADFIGLDVCLAIMEVLQQGLGDDKYRACPLLRQMVQAGRLGRKTGRGFYDY